MIFTVFLLAFQGDQIQSLIEGLGSDYIEVREEATASLVAAGERAVPALLGAQGTQDPEVHARIVDLLRRSASNRPSTSLDLSLDEPKRGMDGFLKVTLHAKTVAKVPVLIHLPGLRVAGFAVINPASDRFVLLQPNESMQVDLEGTRFAKNAALIPFYCDSREAFGSSPSVRVFRMQNADAQEAAKLLHDLFMRQAPSHIEVLKIAVDLSTRSVVVRGAADHLESAKKVITELDRAPEEETMYVVTIRCGRPAADLAKDLEKLLRPVLRDKK